MNANDWERRVINRVPENTTLNAENVLKFFDAGLQKYETGCRIFHNGLELEKGTDFDILENEGDAAADTEIRLKRQLQPNDRFGVSPTGAPAE